MSANSTEIVRLSIQEAASAAASLVSQLRAFAQEGDDEEVCSLFALQADQTKVRHDRLSARIGQLGGAAAVEDRDRSIVARAPETLPSLHSQEEQIARNVITAFSLAHGELAACEALAAIAHTAGDATTETLAREIQAEAKRTAESAWRLIPSRSKIAFNMLTVGELDPSVETRAADNRVYS